MYVFLIQSAVEDRIISVFRSASTLSTNLRASSALAAPLPGGGGARPAAKVADAIVKKGRRGTKRGDKRMAASMADDAGSGKFTGSSRAAEEVRLARRNSEASIRQQQRPSPDPDHQRVS